MADWQTLALIHILVGYEADLLGMIPFRDDGSRTVNGLLVVGFLFYTVVAVIVSLMKWADLKLPEKIINIILIILLILAGLLVVAGVGVADSDTHYPDVYHSMLEVIGALFAFISAVFLILLLVAGGDSKTSPA